jgi:putative ABC transport system permease protein
MFDVDVWQEILATIKKNKLRTFLTGFSVAWGIFMLMVLLGSGNGLQNGVMENFKDNSINIMWLWTGETSMPYKGLKEGRTIKFKNDDYTFLTEKAEGIDKVSSRFFLPGNVVYSYKNEYGSFSTSACYPALQEMEKININKGRFINNPDMTDLRKSIVLGEKIYKTLFKDEDPMGKYIKLNNVPFKVVGSFHDKRGDYDRTAYIPFSTAQRIFNGADRVHTFSLTTKMVNTVEEADTITQHVRRDMALRHQFDPKDTRAMGSFNMLAEYFRTRKIFEAIKIFIWIIGIGTLIAGIVGVSNIMLILVKERTREIGIRKALGASPSSVIGLVLLESILITTVAGYTGLVLGTGVMESINYGLDKMLASGAGEGIFFRNPTVDLTTAVVSTLLLIISGAFAGYFPARKAANVKPVEALRDE